MENKRHGESAGPAIFAVYIILAILVGTIMHGADSPNITTKDCVLGGLSWPALAAIMVAEWAVENFNDIAPGELDSASIG